MVFTAKSVAKPKRNKRLADISVTFSVEVFMRTRVQAGHRWCPHVERIGSISHGHRPHLSMGAFPSNQDGHH